MQRKATRQSRAANAAEKRHMQWIKERCICAACSCAALVINHHCMGSTFRNNKILVGHWFVLGLCQSCDNLVTRGSKRALTEAFGPQSEMWLKQAEHYPEEIPLDVIQAIAQWGR